MERHFTVSGFVVHEGRVALHWHRKLGMWLPAGGHIEANEDPVQAVLREVREEFALEAEVLPLAARTTYTGGTVQLEPPHALHECKVAEGHYHIDCVYYCRLLSGYPGRSHDGAAPVIWFGTEELERGWAERDGAAVPFPPDVQAFALEAIRQAARVQTGAAAHA